MFKGKVKYFNERKGWGFIAGPDPDRSVYVHYSAIKSEGYRNLTEGEEVSYDLAWSDDTAYALNVTPDNSQSV